MGADEALVVRTTDSADAPALARLLTQMRQEYGAPHPELPEVEADLAQLPTGVDIFVAERPDGSFVGLAAVANLYPGPGLSGGFFLKELYVSPQARSLGVGESLMRALARAARDRGFRRIDWTVATENAGALRFYDRLGAAAQTDRFFYRLGPQALDALADS
jgi:ribosomal protein S18 acetylase RimI-like enzyme